MCCKAESLKRVLCVIIVVLTIFIASNASADSFTDKKTYKIGLAVLKDNHDYHEGRSAFVNFLEAQKDMAFDFKLLDAYGDSEAYVLGLKRFVEVDKVDMIFTTGTRSTVPAIEIADSIPVVFTAVANPVESGIATSLENSGNNLTGTHCGIPATPQVLTIKKILPQAKTLGIVYTKNESNADIQTKDFYQAADALQLNVLTATVDKNCKSEEEVGEATEKLVGKVDVLIAHQDTCLSRYGRGMLKVAEESGIPTYVTLGHLISQGAVMSLNVNFNELGRAAGEKALMIFQNKTMPRDIPITTSKKYSLTLNLSAAKKINIQIPVQILRTASKLVK